MTQRSRTVALVGASLAFVVGGVQPLRAASPRVQLDRSTARLGERVVVTLRGWPARRSVVVAICGNAAARGTNDCDLVHGAGLGLSDADTVHVAELVVTRPPVPCPCVVRVADARQSTVVSAPIDLPELPSVAPAADRFETPFVLSLDVTRASVGLVDAMRSWLGGPTTYLMSVTVRNRSAEAHAGMRLRAVASRGGHDQSRVVQLPAPGSLGPGATWRHTERVTLAAPVVGTFEWRLTASGAGAVRKREVSSSHFPFLLYLLGVGLAVDLGLIARRWYRRRLHRRARARFVTSYR